MPLNTVPSSSSSSSRRSRSRSRSPPPAQRRARNERSRSPISSHQREKDAKSGQRADRQREYLREDLRVPEPPRVNWSNVTHYQFDDPEVDEKGLRNPNGCVFGECKGCAYCRTLEKPNSAPHSDCNLMAPKIEGPTAPPPSPVVAPMTDDNQHCQAPPTQPPPSPPESEQLPRRPRNEFLRFLFSGPNPNPFEGMAKSIEETIPPQPQTEPQPPAQQQQKQSESEPTTDGYTESQRKTRDQAFAENIPKDFIDRVSSAHLKAAIRAVLLKVPVEMVVKLSRSQLMDQIKLFDSVGAVAAKTEQAPDPDKAVFEP